MYRRYCSKTVSIAAIMYRIAKRRCISLRINVFSTQPQVHYICKESVNVSKFNWALRSSLDQTVISIHPEKEGYFTTFINKQQLNYSWIV